MLQHCKVASNLLAGMQARQRSSPGVGLVFFRPTSFRFAYEGSLADRNEWNVKEKVLCGQMTGGKVNQGVATADSEQRMNEQQKRWRLATTMATSTLTTITITTTTFRHLTLVIRASAPSAQTYASFIMKLHPVESSWTCLAVTQYANHEVVRCLNF